ncbi:glycine cleavage system protein GcvH [Hyphobacterium marinum]|uniref:Glycine cleavage system H protein n=1 Tax=Hyphobacterium marinum TaxID=3116574 RepID=A0ABU7LWV8_9PROT|nr:glycine cleavage system protein GcvH [Hyphobacterium sp. Y6023]MEE2566032.1 glycine cleavage system protein GcvH [Hyphobacterium sp. Y6023]
MTTKFTKDHEWIRVEGDEAIVGVTAYAAEQLGDVVFVELPDVGRSVTAGDEMAVVESVKAASEVYAPIAGEVVAVNDALEDAPQTVNESPDADGWFVRLKIADKSQLDGLMDEAAYKAHIG